jgi:TetR/AcrR family transcriptional regulator, regulator of cefoperazone and chloramphenicol sensitivity
VAVDRSSEDLTARARIRDAALHLFAERGIGPATIRDIAKAAGVSSGLVRHHFGSKEALRDACDAYALDTMNRLREQMFDEGRLTDSTFMASIHPVAILLQGYLVRSMMDGSDAAMSMFEHMVQIGEKWLADEGIESRDVRAYAVVLVAMKLSAYVMRDQISAALGVDVRTPAGSARMNRGFVEAFTNPLVTPEQAAQIHAAIDAVLGQTPHQAAPDDAATKE